MKNKQVIEYEEAPSGSVVFYNYKEPLMLFEGDKIHSGYGYRGALIFDSVTDKIQCHFCGNWFEALGNHLKREHNMSAEYYKKTVGLNKTTALINEKTRATLIASGLEKRMKNLVPRKGLKVTEETKEKIRQTLKEHRAEIQNIQGTCPAQLLDRFKKDVERLGRMPSQKRDEIPYYTALIKTYGSLEEVCRLTGIEYRKSGKTIRNMGELHRQKSVDFVRNFFDKNGRLPKGLDMDRKMQATISRKGRKEIFKEALSQDGIYKKTDVILRYDKDQLIDFLRVFEKVNHRKPSYSDCKRNLLPHLSRYSYNFGSWKKALAIAFPEN